MKKTNKIIIVILLLVVLSISVTAIDKITKEKDPKVDEYITKEKGDLTTEDYQDNLVEEIILERIKEDNTKEMFRLARNVLNKNPDNIDNAITCLQQYEIIEEEILIE